ncbi:kinase-like domain-containing protein [Gigaspora rosea]|uniref:Kinase-like domain-containing protein n=1 Tax=Gigaspora rosea TaxID=44941 RepID=A0A397UYV6_9GLOM|nr:kinase-like domain-containing protein [Gigaspora rosea]
MKWEDKLSLLHCITSDLQAIHSQNYIHQDLHSGNILQETLQSARIGDLGLSVLTSRNSKIKSNGVYGILPYIPPEVLRNQPYTAASDIYSFGIIMWEILFGIPVTGIYAIFHERFGSQLEIQIALNELRPPIHENIETCYINLMKKCWENDPEKRPSAIEICEAFAKWQIDIKILSELTEYDTKIKQRNIIDDIIINKVNSTNEIYSDQFFSYTKLQSAINNSESKSKNLIINFEEFISLAKNSDNSFNQIWNNKVDNRLLANNIEL